MKVLVLGASGATGRLVVMQFLKRKIATRILIRESAVLSQDILENPLLETVKGNINELDQSAMHDLVQGCDTIISCLGHTISFKGIFGQPHYLVLDAVRKLCKTANENTEEKVKLILMSTTAYTNTVSGEKNSLGEMIIFSLLMCMLPPHRDNIKAANFLIEEIGLKNKKIEWVAVRPDTLIDEELESPTEIFESPQRSPIFDAGKTSRINVSQFMADLATDEKIWKQWLGKTPVLYNV
jgi:nucleoside-diphosphate-sugar epimerase